MSTALRCLPLLALLLLGACQSTPPAGTDAAQPSSKTRQRLDKQLATGELDAATLTYQRLRRHDPASAENYRQLLADAWLQRSQHALEQGDLNAATAALANARALMPKAPALTNDLGGALQRPAGDAAQ